MRSTQARVRVLAGRRAIRRSVASARRSRRFAFRSTLRALDDRRAHDRQPMSLGRPLLLGDAFAERLREGVDVGPAEALGTGKAPVDKLTLNPALPVHLRGFGDRSGADLSQSAPLRAE